MLEKTRQELTNEKIHYLINSNNLLAKEILLADKQMKKNKQLIESLRNESVYVCYNCAGKGYIENSYQVSEWVYDKDTTEYGGYMHPQYSKVYKTKYKKDKCEMCNGSSYISQKWENQIEYETIVKKSNIEFTD